MHGRTLIAVYERLRGLGAVRSKRDFAIRMLGRGPTYLRDLAARNALTAWISTDTTRTLRARLDGLRDALPAPLRGEVATLIDMIERDDYVAGFLR